MNVQTHLLPPLPANGNAAHPSREHPSQTIAIDGGFAIIIDVLRATSVMTTALASGAHSVTTFADIDAAREYAQTLRDAGQQPYLGGERECRPIDGFDAGNSPSEYGVLVAGRPVIITTTNGTRAIESATGAHQMGIASFLNLSTVIAEIASEKQVHLVCSGTNGQITLEDVLLAGAILSRLQTIRDSVTICDSSRLAMAQWQTLFGDSPVGPGHSADLSIELSLGLGGRNLTKVGYDTDFARCSAIDSISRMPRRIQTTPAQFV